MNEPQLSVEEILELELLEGGIPRAFWDICAVLREVETQRLYRAQCPTFSDYLHNRWPQLRLNKTTWRQWRASYEELLIAESKVVLTPEEEREPMSELNDLMRLLARMNGAHCAGCGTPVSEEMYCADCVGEHLEQWKLHCKKIDEIVSLRQLEEHRYTNEKREWHAMRMQARANHVREGAK